MGFCQHERRLSFSVCVAHARRGNRCPERVQRRGNLSRARPLVNGAGQRKPPLTLYPRTPDLQVLYHDVSPSLSVCRPKARSKIGHLTPPAASLPACDAARLDVSFNLACSGAPRWFEAQQQTAYDSADLTADLSQCLSRHT